MRKIFVLIAGIILILVLCSCDSEEVKQAKEAYEAEEYSKAVEILSKEKDLSEEAKDILIISEANVLYEKKDYFGAVKKLSTSSKGIEEEKFDDMFKKALEDSIAKNKPNNVVELVKLDKTKEDKVYKAITKACKDKNYNGFAIIDGLSQKLSKGDLKTKLEEFEKENDILKAEAFLVGTWQWKVKGYKKPMVVKVIPYNNNLVGRIVNAGDYLADYHYKKDDIYWNDFSFENSRDFICYNLTKYEDGSVVGRTTSGKINYEKGIMKLNVTGAGTPIRLWKRIK